MGTEQIEQIQIRPDIDTDRLTSLSTCLSTITVDSPSLKPKISILPNLIKTVADYALERKKVAVIEKRDQKIYSLYKRDLELREKQSDQLHERTMKQQEHDYQIKMATILSERDTRLKKINADREVALAQIEQAEQTEVQRIERDFDIRLKTIAAEYAIKIRELDDQKEKFMATLSESGRRFDQQMRMLRRGQVQREKLHQEAMLMCEQLRKQSKNGRLDPAYMALLQIAADAQKENFQLIATLNRIFAPTNNQRF